MSGKAKHEARSHRSYKDHMACAQMMGVYNLRRAEKNKKPNLINNKESNPIQDFINAFKKVFKKQKVGESK